MPTGATVGRAAGGGGGAAGWGRRASGAGGDGDEGGDGDGASDGDASAVGGDELAADRPDAVSVRLTTGVGTVSNGSPLTSGAGARSSRLGVERLPRRADSRSVDALDVDARGAGTSAVLAATGAAGGGDEPVGAPRSGWTNPGSSKEGSPGPMEPPPEADDP